MKASARKQHAPRPQSGVDPALMPFLDTLAALLAAQERRIAESRRALQAVAHLSGKAKGK